MRARNLHRLPKAVDYMISAETGVISQFYQDQLVAQGKAALILLSAILRPCKPLTGE